MRIVQVVADIAPESGGPSQSVPALCQSLAERGLAVSLHVLDSGTMCPWSRSPKYDIVQHAALPVLRQLGVSPSMSRALRKTVRRSHVCHSHGVWMMPNIYPAWAVRGAECRLVVSPRGMLEPFALARSWARKRLMWWLCQGAALRQAACFHATAESEYESIRKLGFRQPVAIIPNGVEVPDPLPPAVGGRRQLLFLGRLHPKKGLDILIQAWRRIQDHVPQWDLHVVGPNEGDYGTKMQELARSIGAERVFFSGPAWGEQRTAAYAQADLFILPTHSENFGIAVAEALAHGVPAIVSKGAPWAGLETNRCGWWIDLSEIAVADCLRFVLGQPREVLRQFGARGREWMLRDFSWSGVGRMMHETYGWLVDGGMPPSWVRVDCDPAASAARKEAA